VYKSAQVTGSTGTIKITYVSFFETARKIVLKVLVRSISLATVEVTL